MNYKLQQQQAADARRAAAQQASAASYLAAMGGGGGAGSASKPGAAKLNYSAKTGFQFRDSNGRPINAAQYAQLMGIGYRKLLSQMASKGDANAKIALKYVGDDYKFGSAPQQYAGALGALGATGSYLKPKTSGPSYNTSIIGAPNKGWA